MSWACPSDVVGVSMFVVGVSMCMSCGKGLIQQITKVWECVDSSACEECAYAGKTKTGVGRKVESEGSQGCEEGEGERAVYSVYAHVRVLTHVLRSVVCVKCFMCTS